MKIIIFKSNWKPQHKQNIIHLTRVNRLFILHRMSYYQFTITGHIVPERLKNKEIMLNEKK